VTAALPLSGKHALVTGANRGIGASIVRELASQGAAVTLMVRDGAAAERVAKSVAVRTHIAVADVTDREAVQRGCADAAAAIGPVDILVNNAGTVETLPFLRSTDGTFLTMFSVHVLGAVHTSQAVLPSMIDRGGGRIVNVASIAGLFGAPYVAHYVAAKHALVGLTRALATEFAHKGITVNAVCPGYTDTDLVSGSLGLITAKTGKSETEALAQILKDAGQPRLVLPHEVAQGVAQFCLPAGASKNGETLVLMGKD
jgi:NAD(P)-dependent dehydrogenase (short-subunit alcohol dehydrogenase family)